MHDTSNPATPVAKLKSGIDTNIISLTERIRSVKNSEQSPITTLARGSQKVLYYEQLLRYADSLLVAISKSCRTEDGARAMAFVIAAESGKIDNMPPHAELFSQIANQVRELKPTVNITISSPFVSLLETFTKVAAKDSRYGLMACCYLFSVYRSILKPHLLETCMQDLVLDVAHHPYWTANSDENLALSITALFDAFEHEVTADDKQHQDESVRRIIHLTERIICDAFLIPQLATGPAFHANVVHPVPADSVTATAA